jgi:hypothetical protein
LDRKAEERAMKKVFKGTSQGKTSVGRPRQSWLDDLDNYHKKMGVRGWRKIGKDTDVGKLILEETRVLHGP